MGLDRKIRKGGTAMLGYVRAAACSPKLEIGDVWGNLKEIEAAIAPAQEMGAEVLVFPELSLTGYSCGDLFFQNTLIESAEKAVARLAEYTKEMAVFLAVGVPVRIDNQLFNCAVLLYGGRVLGLVPKTYIPGYSEFYEERWFSSAADLHSTEITYAGQQVPIGADLLFSVPAKENLVIGIEICEDLWAPIPPSSYLAQAGATLILNLSASNDIVTKNEYRRSLVQGQSARLLCGYVYASAGMYESTTDLVFGGHCLLAENGQILKESCSFSLSTQFVCADVDVSLLMSQRQLNTSFMSLFNKEQKYRKCSVPLLDRPLGTLLRSLTKFPFVPEENALLSQRCEQIFTIQRTGLARRFLHVQADTAVIAISGGLDSTLALLCTVKAFDFLKKGRKQIIGVTMPGFGTTGRTYQNALQLMKSLGISYREISIEKVCLQHFNDIGQDPNRHDVTYENAQARERTQIVMDIANMENGLVVGTGDLSELALGFTTYNGDHMSMYGVNAGIPKTLVRALVDWASKEGNLGALASEVLQDILCTPVSPELLPPALNGEIQQKTEEVVGPYELIDFFLYYFLRFGFSPKKIFFLAKQVYGDEYETEVLLHWMRQFYRRFFTQQFKRSCLPDGPKVGTVSLSPRGDWRMPSDASARLWLREIDQLEEEK